MKYSSLILFYFIISFELLSMEQQEQQVKTASSLGDLEVLPTEADAVNGMDNVTNNKKNSKSQRNSGNFENLNLNFKNLDLEELNFRFVKQPEDLTSAKVAQVIAAHQLLLNDIKNSNEKHQNELSQNIILNFTKYKTGRPGSTQSNKDISPDTTKRITYVNGKTTPGNFQEELKKIAKEKIKNGHNAKHGENGADEKNGEIN